MHFDDVETEALEPPQQTVQRRLVLDRPHEDGLGRFGDLQVELVQLLPQRLVDFSSKPELVRVKTRPNPRVGDLHRLTHRRSRHPTRPGETASRPVTRHASDSNEPLWYAAITAWARSLAPHLV